MDVALCYENVIATRGGAERYISDLACRLGRDGHAVHIYACRWDPAYLPPATHYHHLPAPTGPRFYRPWKFGQIVEEALRGHRHDVTIGFDKTWGQDVLYPLGGLHVASAAQNLLKHPPGITRFAARILKRLDLAGASFRRLERKQYLSEHRPQVIAISRMVQGHFEKYYDYDPAEIKVIPCAAAPERFAAEDRPKRRHEEREKWNVSPDEPVGLFVAMNYRLKGLGPLLHAMAKVNRSSPLRLAIVGSPKTAAYERLAKRLGIADRVRFLGFRADPRDAFFAADFLVHPTFYDPCSLVVLEAMCCGLPVITTRYNGASEFITPGTDGLVLGDPHDARTFAEALEKLSDAKTRSAFAAAIRQSARRWSFEDHYREMMNVFRQVAGRRLAA